jgi:hypothetical protein
VLCSYALLDSENLTLPGSLARLHTDNLSSNGAVKAREMFPKSRSIGSTAND